MLLWFVVAISFIVCATIWQLLSRITFTEASALFIASGLVFFAHLEKIYSDTVTDTLIVTGYVTSKRYRPSYKYKCGKYRSRTCTRPDRYILEQRPQKAKRNIKVTRKIDKGQGVEHCFGECEKHYENIYHKDYQCCDGGNYTHLIKVDLGKYRRAKLGEPSSSMKKYFNPVRVSDDLIFDEGAEAQRLPLQDFNVAKRVTPFDLNLNQELQELSATQSSSNLSVGLIFTEDELYYEKLKRAWKQGRINELTVVVLSKQKEINNVDVLGWDNYLLKQNIIHSLIADPSLSKSEIIEKISYEVKNGPKFEAKDLSKYKFLDVKIPQKKYASIIWFQIILTLYQLLLLYFNPNTKDYKLSIYDVACMWSKTFSPPSRSWYLHPATPYGFFLYIVVPVMASLALI